jgi:hypothetical protein
VSETNPSIVPKQHRLALSPGFGVSVVFGSSLISVDPSNGRRRSAMKTACLALVVINLVLLLGFPAISYAQENGSDEALKSVLNAQHEFIQHKIARVRAEIESWRRNWLVLVVLTALVAVFGVLSAAMQARNEKWAKISTGVMGVAVGVVTATTAVVFPEDHRMLRLKILEAEAPLDEIEYRLREDHIGRNLGERRALLNELIEKFKVIDQLQQSPLRRSSISFLPAVYAQAGAPSWTSKAPVDSVNFYFQGSGESSSLKDASELSHADAVRQAVAFLRERTKGSNEGTVMSYVERYAEIADRSFTYKKTYQHFTLLKLNRSYAEPAFLRAYLITESPRSGGKGATLRVQLDRIFVVADGSAGPTGWTFEARVKGGETLFSLPIKDYDDRPNRNVYVPTAFDRAAADISVPANRLVELEIQGRRTSGVGKSDIVIGSQALGAGGPLTITVTNPKGERDGSFVFFLSASPR